MPIKTSEGRAWSERSDQEDLQFLKEAIDKLTPEEREALDVMLDEMSQTGRSGLFDSMGDIEYNHRPVDIETFVKDEYFLGKTCDTLRPKLLEDLKEMFSGYYSEVIFSGAIGWGKCLKSLSFLPAGPKGRLTTIEELAGGSAEVPSLDEGEIGYRKASEVWKSGRKECLKLVLASGQYLEASFDHPVLTQRGYVPLKDLKVGEDLVAAARSIPAPEEPVTCYSDAEVIVAGYYTADGMGNGHGQAGYIKGIKQCLDDFNRRIAEVPGYEGTSNEFFSKGAWYTYPKGVLPWLRDLGLDKGSKDKRVPPQFFGLPDAQVALYLSRVFGDGNVYTGSPRKIEWSSASEGLVDDVQLLLRRLGIVARKSKKTKTASKGGKLFDSWQLQIADIPTQLLFLDQIGIFGKEESCDRLRSEILGRKSNPNWDIVPITTEELKEIRRETGPWKNSEWSKLGGLAAGSRMGRRKFIRLCEETNYQGRYRKFADMDVVWERISEVKEIGEADVYDLTVPGPANAVVNGIVVHNTYTASIAICRILYELSCMKDPHRTYGIAPDSNISIVGLSVSEELATKVVFENIATKIDASRYFADHFPYERTKKELRFPGNIWVAARASTTNNALGLNVIAALIDEGNFMPKGTDPRFQGVDKAEVLYNSLKRRLKSRFQDLGRLPGAIFVISSKMTDEDFTAKRVRQAGEEEDPTVFVRDYCLSGDTVVPLLDGTTPTLEELARRYENSDERFWVYSIDKGRVVPGMAYKPRMTSESEEVLEVLLDNGESIVATPWHPFMLRSGKYVRADALKEGDSLMPLYTKMGGRNEGYEYVSHPLWQGEWQATHHMSAVAAYGRWPKKGEDGLPTVVHHENFDKRDNRPENLRVMEWTAHRRLHSENMEALSTYVKTKKHREYASQHMKRLHQDPEFAARRDIKGAEHFRAMWEDPQKRKELSEAAGERLSKFHRTELGRKRQSERSLNRWKGNRKVDLHEVQRLALEGYLCREVAEVMGCCPQAITKALIKRGTNYTKLKNGEDYLELPPKDRAPSNHRVVGIRSAGFAKVYDLSVEKYENFAVGAGVFVHNSLWDVFPEGTYGDERFCVLVGNEQTPSKILDEDEKEFYKENKPKGCVLLDVPEEFRTDFEADLEGSIRDLGGIATVSVSPFIQRREKIEEAVDYSRKHPAVNPSTGEELLVYDPSKKIGFSWAQITRPRLERVGESRMREERLRPLLSPDAPRHVHIDAALTNDSLGFAMVHIGGWKDVVRRNAEGEPHVERAPIYVADLTLQVVPPPGDEIILGDIRELIYTFTEKGYIITMVTLDQFQGADTRQTLAKKGYKTDTLSVDRTTEPYDNLKTAMYEDRLRIYPYRPLLKELRELELHFLGNSSSHRKKRKVDHPKNGSKDISDALAGACWTLSTQTETMPLPMLGNIQQGDAWLLEQKQAQAAGNYGAGDNKSLSDYSELPPFLFGDGGDDGWGGW